MAIPNESSGPFYQDGLTLITSWIGNYIHYKWWDEIAYPFLNFNGLGMDKYFHPICFWPCNYLSMLGLKLIHVSRRGHSRFYNDFTSYILAFINTETLVLFVSNISPNFKRIIARIYLFDIYAIPHHIFTEPCYGFHNVVIWWNPCDLYDLLMHIHQYSIFRLVSNKQHNTQLI